jgi:hypothetical protein
LVLPPTSLEKQWRPSVNDRKLTLGEKGEAMELWAAHIERLVMPEGVKALR